jgi:hypothetical protein
VAFGGNSLESINEIIYETIFSNSHIVEEEPHGINWFILVLFPDHSLVRQLATAITCVLSSGKF